jgi:hypothetical protein
MLKVEEYNSADELMILFKGSSSQNNILDIPKRIPGFQTSATHE